MSIQNILKGYNRELKIFFYFTVIAVFILAVLPGEKIPRILNFWDKAQHSLAFVVLSLLAIFAYPQNIYPRLIGLVLYGGVIEIIQWFLPWRSGDIYDFIADSLGVLIVGLVYLLFVLTNIKKPTTTSNKNPQY